MIRPHDRGIVEQDVYVCGQADASICIDSHRPQRGRHTNVGHPRIRVPVLPGAGTDQRFSLRVDRVKVDPSEGGCIRNRIGCDHGDIRGGREYLAVSGHFEAYPGRNTRRIGARQQRDDVRTGEGVLRIVVLECERAFKGAGDAGAKRDREVRETLWGNRIGDGRANCPFD